MPIRTESTDLHFLDTNILIYALMPGDARQETAEQLVADGGLVSVQVLNEFISVTRRRFHTPWSEVRALLRIIHRSAGVPVPVDAAVQARAVDIAERHGFHIYDASVVAAGLIAGCDTLYTEDMQDGQQVEGLVLCNPFLA